MEYLWQLPHSCTPKWLSKTSVELRVWAPHAERVEVELGCGKIVAMSQETQTPDFHNLTLKGIKPGSQYRFLIHSSWNDCYEEEGEVLVRRDPWAYETDFNSAWCSLIAPQNKKKSFSPPTPSSWVMYELHPGSFIPHEGSGSVLSKLRKKLSYIEELGYNAIQLMPLTEFGGLWGYNPRQLMSVHGKYGTCKELHQLIDEAHQRGIAICLDIVLNHGSSKLNSLWNYDGYGPHSNGGIYFEGEVDTPWGRRFAFHKNEVKDYLKGACRMWIEDYHIDALRFDSVHNMPWWLLQEMSYEIRSHYPEVYLIAEITPENPAVITDAGFDSCWIHSSHFDMKKIMKKYDGGENSDKCLRMLKSMIGLHSGFPNSKSAINSILGSHDQCGDRKNGHEDGGVHRHAVARFGGRHNWHGRAQVRMWYSLQCVSRALPMVFMGTENLQDGWWHIDEHHCFDWNLAQGNDSHAPHMQSLVKKIHALRTGQGAFQSEDLRIVHQDASAKVIAFMRWQEGSPEQGAYLCILHYGEEEWLNGDYRIYTDWGSQTQWQEEFNSQRPEFGGYEEACNQGVLSSDEESAIHLTLPKWSLIILKKLEST
ncbi:MAG: alpha amylase C-terminal domain-containing protein [Planctomycetes bacterium]|nr:alpha amylase C-terminal domain-containing protein [Planctomycetota bacterium]